MEGEKMITELLEQSSLGVEGIYATAGWIENNAAIERGEAPVNEVTTDELRKISGMKNPNKVLAVVNRREWNVEAERVENDYSLYLDGIRDPGNLGTILRIADWFGLPYVFGSADCVDLYNPKVIQASMGAFLRVRYVEIDFSDLQAQFPNLPVLGAVLDGENVFETDLPGRGLLVIGSEAQGISPVILRALTHHLSVPSVVGGGAESLNAAVATGILTAVLRNPGKRSG